MKTSTVIVALLTGVLFGFGLAYSAMVKPEVVLTFLRFQDFGLLVDHPEARLYKLAEEHGFVDVSQCHRAAEVGEVVRILPNHVCPVSNLFDTLLAVRGGEPVERLVITARGKVN